ncbi:MAG: class I SAM-dependent methyltransferase [Candidatus Lokiarchaeota archaeon]|nr:class I SAM-dependent methyltransferase [Candidatus Lokiarchaeota archaeon]
MLRYKIKRLTKNYSIKSLVDFTYKTYEGLIKPKQKTSEIIQLLELLKPQKLHVIVEIGTMKGGTLFLLSRIATNDAIIISIDLPRAKFGGGYPKYRVPLYKSFVSKNQKIFLIRADSHSKFTLKKVQNLLKDKKVDLLFLDGDHTYRGVKKDFEMYKSLLNEQGIVGFHDIVVHPGDQDVNVNKLWNEIKEDYEYLEIVEDWDQQWAGIGYIKKKKR